MKKTLKDFFENHASYPKIYARVWRKAGVDFKEFKEYPNDYRDPSSGSVPGMIYYYDTVPFGKRNFHVALDIANDVDMSIKDFQHEDRTIDYNKVSWFLYEMMIIELIDYVEY